MTSNGRVARLTALALATGTLVAANATGASAATTTQDAFTAGNAAGNGIIHLVLNLPVSLPGIGSKLTQDLVVTKSATRSGAAPAALASAVLGQNGNVPLVSNLLAGSSEATLAHPNGLTKSGLPILGNTLGLAGVLNLTSKVTNPNVDGVTSHSLSSVADFKLDGANVLSSVLQPVLDQVNSVLGSLKVDTTGSAGTAAAPVTSTVTGLVNTVLSQIDAVTNNTTAPVSAEVKAALDQVTTLLTGLLTNIKLNLNSLNLNSSLLDIGLIKSEQTVTRAAGTVTSSVHNQLADISVLGGLVGLKALTSTATAAVDKAGNPVGPSKTATGSSNLLQANISDVLVATVTSQINALLGGSVGSLVPADLLATINGALNQVTNLTTDLLGVSFKPASAFANPTVKAHNKNTQEAAAAVLTVDPLKSAAAPLLQIAFAPAAASVVRSESVTTIAPVTPPTTVTSLPRTGANLPLTGVIATGLVGLALVARRRRAAHLGA
jgi:hypothetical protein